MRKTHEKRRQEDQKLATLHEDKDITEEGSKRGDNILEKNEFVTIATGGGASGSEQEEWELTWPIWHMLPWLERKELAKKYGYKSIGEFEEYMSLERALDNSSSPQPYDNELAYHPDLRAANNITNTKDFDPERERSKFEKDQISETCVDVGDDDYDDCDKNSGDGVGNMSDICTHNHAKSNDNKIELRMEDEKIMNNNMENDFESEEEYYEHAGYVLKIPEDLLHKVFGFLPVTVYTTLALVSPYWKHMTRTESVHKKLCQRIYLNQSKKAQLRIHRFQNSYYNMLCNRPRILAGSGVYVLKYSRVRKIQRDMWTEIPVGAILETTYYRYLYFFEDGTCLYALSTKQPQEIFHKIYKVLLKSSRKNQTNDDPTISYGTYQIQKNNLVVIAKQSYQFVKFALEIELPPNNNSGGIYKSSLQPNYRFGALVMKNHYTSETGDFNDYSYNRVEFEVPLQLFRFIKDKRF